MNERIALFPGSFDPVTLGHVNLIERALPLFDKVIVALGVNAQKQYLFTAEQRLQWLHEIFDGDPRISVEQYTGLTIDFCRQKNARYILRGLRSAADYEYEKVIALTNRSMDQNVETVSLMTVPELSFISSSIVRELIKLNGKFDHLVPVCVSRDASRARHS